ncbi:hypothetical protein GCM10022239_08500 [Leifsonia bigeumensis]|uniref:Enoyl-CoA hydratase n=1 Tax=Leifsonella bigeumensis TaxID=433643 RepID=A0ABP7FAA8_9MICO
MSNDVETPVLLNLSGHVLTVTINRPAARNALRVADKRRIADILDEAAAGDARCVVLTGAGDQAFCAGSDLKEMSKMDTAGFLAMERVEAQMYDAIMRNPLPVIAAVHGWALGTGCVLAAASDLVVADPGANFGQPEILNGAPTPIHGALLPRIVGLNRARWLVLTGRTITAATALDWGLVSEVSPPGAALDVAQTLAASLVEDVHPGSMALQKQIVDGWVRHSFGAAVDGSMFIAATAYGSGWPQSAAARMRGRRLRRTGEAG